jgi:hypothetical protein
MKRPALAALALSVLPLHVEASGPIGPSGWGGLFAPKLPGGQECCIPADLSGTKLTGGAFVLLSDDKKRFAVFALTYSSSKRDTKENWSLLESNTIESLPKYKVAVVPATPGRNPGVSVCEESVGCRRYFWSTEDKRFNIAKLPQ